ncbi:MAG: LysE family translocator [Sphingobium sp.]|uniref:LysE family translocator n=1 Tax=Sphingobium sp. TaxID=1912891 RepID=UPI00299FE7BA|nr:LysE family translocator [Sphingobium sp.]MDX3910677.1 LysE family translocator [Sphingobium sp.]
MESSTFASLALFSVAMSITPGPNNLLLTTSGVAHGFRRSLPTLFGTLLGLGILFLVSGAGVGALIISVPQVELALRVLGALYLLYLAWRLWTASGLSEGAQQPPLRVWHGVVFQFVNPKAWMMTISAVSIYVAPAADYWPRLILVTATFLLISLPSITLWTGFGAGMKAMLKDSSRAIVFNRGMAVLTVLSAVLVLLWT